MHIVKFTKTLALTVVLGNKEDLAVAEDFFQTVDKSDGLLRLHAVFISENIVVTMNGVVVPRHGSVNACAWARSSVPMLLYIWL
jgi:hypothetical protein